MSAATLEIYRTESGSVYEVMADLVRRAGEPTVDGTDHWQRYTAINRLPAALFTPGTTGEVLEIVLADGRRLYTSRLVMPDEVTDRLW